MNDSERLVFDAEQQKVLRAFMADGRLKAMPVKLKKRFLVLDHFARLFSPGQDYAEGQVNALITPIFEDYCTVRRELVEYGFMARDSAGYRRLQPDGWMPEL